MVFQLPEIYVAPKTMATRPSWVERADGWLFFVCPLDIDGITREGLRLRVKAVKNQPDERVMIQIEYEQRERRDYAVDRIDWKPNHDHTNENKGPHETRLVHIPAGISHHHSFPLNWHTREGRLLATNLPVAMPIPKPPKTFDELLEFAAKSLNIKDLGTLPPPPWEGLLI